MEDKNFADTAADEEENLFGDDYNTAFVKTLLRVQNNVINLPGGREHFDIYLAKTIYPVLVPGLESLAREIDRFINSDGEFLMRNNPKYGHKLEYTDIFKQYAKIEKIRRFFSIKRQKVYKHFMLQPYQGNFVKRHIKEFIKSIDDFLKIEGKLVANFQIYENFPHLGDDEVVTFERFYDILSKWAIQQDKMSYEDFATFEDEAAKEEQIEAFKKMTDRIL
ncbi:UNKNOWN [Stylonychia lemnae]|uniref:Uncharacterized protein n=1 Tax=Stylonychia lemnae TaxID=5949 RepID=A0A078AJF1_STYLE|nr:UNKNOWN [Stylonychia lemnae]|eukprot:CDW81612.1 UNKNOWN [Stylonychia lemnae]